MTNFPKKITNTDVHITIRIVKALGKHKPFGIFKQFIMLQVLKNLKQPNVISAEDIWKFLYSRYDIKKLDAITNEKYKIGSYSLE
ncbi:chromatin modification-related protein EAF7 domain-containing protein (MRGBP) [Vairimorpha necatrix]|uniref:Chromatin modification-related protein EAF7 domain-containing protein (MRGBP) n=1 Tax=Vairimorpha necatrix TaxID=6039 RepID=A0AAX4J910_9MICR